MDEGGKHPHNGAMNMPESPERQRNVSEIKKYIVFIEL